MGTYSLLDVQAAITGPGGSINLANGAAVSDEGVTVEMDDAKNTMTPGADGSVMHSLHAAKTGKITIRYLKTSPTNKALEQMYNLQTSSSALHGLNTITLNDTARGDNITGRQAAFQKLPSLTYAKDGGMNEWVFDVGRLDMRLGSGLSA